jgi:hypothetical protein
MFVVIKPMGHILGLLQDSTRKSNTITYYFLSIYYIVYLLEFMAFPCYNRRMNKYKHALALYPYFGDFTAAMGVFPPTGLEYIAASIKDMVDNVTFLDLRYETAYQDLAMLSKFIRDRIDLLCISIQWNTRFKQICDFIAKLPHEICTVVGGYKATQEVEYLFNRCPNIDIIVRGEGEEIIKQIVTGIPHKDIRGLSYKRTDSLSITKSILCLTSHVLNFLTGHLESTTIGPLCREFESAITHSILY